MTYKLTVQENKAFYRKLIMFALPAALQQFINAAINLLDTFMLGGVSEDALTAAGLANKLFFVFIVVIFGVASGAAIFIAQFYGKGDGQSVRRYLGIGFTLAAAAAAVFSLIAAIFPENVMRIFSTSDEVVRLGSKYLRITGFSYAFTAFSNTLYIALRSTKHPYMPFAFTALAMTLNASGNFLFIYGLDMGIEGAAWATLIARAAEFAALAVALKVRRTEIGGAGAFKEYFSFSRAQLKKYVAIAGFVVLIEVAWSVGNALYNIAFRVYGTHAQAAVQVTDSCSFLFNVFAMSVGQAAAVIIGQAAGAGKREQTLVYARRLLKIAPLLGAVVGAAVCLAAPALPSLFPSLTEAGAADTRLCLFITGVLLPLHCLEFMLMTGILRSGGDTRFCIVLDVLSVWVLTLPTLLIAAYALKLPFAAVFALTKLEFLIKSAVGSVRVLKSGKWLRDVTVDSQTAAADGTAR